MRNAHLFFFTKTVVFAGAIVFLFNGNALFAQDSPEKTSESVFEVGNSVTAPKGVYTPDPEYSEKARKKKINGTVVVAMIITAQGSCTRREGHQERRRRSRQTGTRGCAHLEI